MTGPPTDRSPRTRIAHRPETVEALMSDFDGTAAPTFTFFQPEEVPNRLLNVPGCGPLARQSGTHHWSIASVYRIEDPEASMDDMTLSQDNWLGVRPITCLWCDKPYADATDPGPFCG